MSSASHDSKRVGTRLLAGDKSGQHGKCKRAKTDVPGPSRPPPSHHRRPTEPVDPPRRRGRLKSRTRKIRSSISRKSTYRLVRPRRGQSGRFERIGYVAYRLQMLGEHPTATKKQRDRPRTIGTGHLQQRPQDPHSRGATSILGKRASAALSYSSNSLRHSFEHSFPLEYKGRHSIVFYLLSFDSPHTP